MVRVRSLTTFAALAALFLAGCTHTQLRWNTVKQAETLSDIYEQQVLDNLAMFVYDANALPYFAFPQEGATIITDRGAVGVGSFNFFRDSVGGDLSRQMQGSWTMNPVTDPHKLALMRCAYQIAVRNCGRGFVSTGCPDCDKRFGEFNGHGHSNDNETCLEGPCWFCVGCKRDVPKNCHCRKVGHYCGVYVWVPSGPGRDELSRLTMAILDYAVHEPAQTRSKQVTYYLTATGQPSTQSQANTVVTANVSVDEQIGALLMQPFKGMLDEVLRELSSNQEDKNRLSSEQLANLQHELASLESVKQLNDLYSEVAKQFVPGAMHDPKIITQWNTQIETAMTDIRNTRLRFYGAPILIREQAVQSLELESSKSGLRDPFIPRQRTPTSGFGILQLQQDLRQVTPLPSIGP